VITAGSDPPVSPRPSSPRRRSSGAEATVCLLQALFFVVSSWRRGDQRGPSSCRARELECGWECGEDVRGNEIGGSARGSGNAALRRARERRGGGGAPRRNDISRRISRVGTGIGRVRLRDVEWIQWATGPGAGSARTASGRELLGHQRSRARRRASGDRVVFSSGVCHIAVSGRKAGTRYARFRRIPDHSPRPVDGGRRIRGGDGRAIREPRPGRRGPRCSMRCASICISPAPRRAAITASAAPAR
jgi:hypothetical protein